jgi:prepilin-type processing-associated H-X9-DG protein
MKTCPSCGEQIQDAARKCRYCGEFLSSHGESGSRPRRRKSSSNSNALVWIIVAVVAGGLLLFVPCLIAVFSGRLMLPAIGQAREAARRAQCRNNLKQIGLALHNYHDTYRSFPPAYLADEQGRPMHSWRVLLLPFLGQQSLYNQYDFSQPWDSPANQWVAGAMPPVFACPSEPNTGTDATNVAAVFGPNCIFAGTEPVKIRDITDGTSNTLMVGEVTGGSIPWTKPQDVDITQNPTLNSGGFASHHSGGVHFLLADGSVRFMSDNINPQTLQILFIRDDGQLVGDF